jgi:hypothetical protein
MAISASIWKKRTARDGDSKTAAANLRDAELVITRRNDSSAGVIARPMARADSTGNTSTGFAGLDRVAARQEAAL